MKVGERRQQGRQGAAPKKICPKCEQDYLKTAWITENRKWKGIGQCCPNPICDYMIKDTVGLEEEEEETAKGIDKAEKIKKLTEEFMKTHDRLNELAEKIKELETE